MDVIAQEDLWFNTIPTNTLCRLGLNGPAHDSQLYAIEKYVKPGMSLLDYGAGSGTTYEAILNKWNDMPFKYMGLDIIKKNAEWCNEHFGVNLFFHNEHLHKIDRFDNSFDVVYSRHVVDHMRGFETAMDEHKRVARNLVIVVLWVPLSDDVEHEIKNIDYRPSGGELFKDEYTNKYSKPKVMEYLDGDPEWKLVEFTEKVGLNDTVIVLEKI